MQFFDINNIPQLVASGKMTIKEGAAAITDIVRSNPASFGLNRINKVLRSSITDRIADNGINILKLFDSADGTMLSQLTIYIRYLTRQHKRLWLIAQRQNEKKDLPRMHGYRAVRHNIARRRKRTFSHHRSYKLSFVSLV